MNFYKIVLLIIIQVTIFNSCTINSNRMLRSPKDFEFSEIDAVLSQIEYKIDINDQLTFQIYTNGGAQLIDMYIKTSNEENIIRLSQFQNTGSLYLVRQDSIIEFPIIGKRNLVGKTIKEAETFLEELFSEFYVDPFVVLGVSTKRIFLFNGSSGGEAAVIPLTFNNMTLFEVLASGGGIRETNNSKKIKIIRKSKEGIKIFNADLSTIDGINQGNMIMQSHDIIYITPNFNLGSEIIQDINSVFSFISTISILLLSINQLK